MIENHDERKMPERCQVLKSTFSPVECKYYHTWGHIGFALPVNVTRELH